MKNELKKIFSEVFEVDINDVENIEYQSVEAWDSIGHMMMISEIESKFSVSIDMDDVVVISNFAECVEILNKYRG